MTLPIQLVIAIALFVAGVAAGIKFESGELAKLKLEYQSNVLDSVREARATESRRYANAVEAENAAKKREQVARAAADAARSESERLRSQLSDAARRLSSAPPDALREYATTVGGLLDHCQREYQGMADKAQGHAGDVRLMQESWPK